MAFDAFLKIPNIPGDSLSSTYKDWIEIESFSWGEERPPSGTGVAVPLEVQLVANSQSASPRLFKACADGVNLGTVQLHLTTVSAISAPQAFFKWDMENAVLGSYRAGGSTADDTPVDRFSIAFTTLTYSYSAQDQKTGSLQPPVVESVPFE